MGGPYQFKPEDAQAFATWTGIRHRSTRSEIVFEVCPFCKSRKDKNTFAISLKTGQYNCKRASCGAKGNMIDLSQVFDFELDRISTEYFTPKRHYKIFNVPKEAIEPTEPAVAYLGGRGIPAEIVKRYQVTSKADKKTGDPIIIFTFFDPKGQPQTIKYRNPKAEKNKEWFETNCKPILYGMDQCNKENKTLIMTEGQIDSLSVAAAGIENAVSVPGGVSSFTWVSYCWDWVCEFDKIVVFGDHEHDHITLYADILRFWKNKAWCVRPEDYKDCKDANDILRKYGPKQIRKCVENATQPPISNIMDLSAVKDVDINRIMKLDIQVGLPDLNNVLCGGLPFGQVVLITGKSGDGKSTLANQFVINALNQSYKCFVYSGELPNYLLKAWLTLQAAGPNHVTQIRSYGDKNIYEVEADAAEQINRWYKDNIWIFDNGIVKDDDEQVVLIDILENVIVQKGVQVVLLDNMMTAMSLEPDGIAQDKYDRQSRFMNKLAQIARDNNILIILVAHKRKMGSNETNDTVSGSADIVNLASVVISYERGDQVDDAENARWIKVTKNRLFGSTSKGMKVYFDESSKRVHQIDVKHDWKCGWEFMTESESEQLELPFPIDEGSE